MYLANLHLEYIGQLESEIASRTNEAHDLRIQNRSLYEENSRLTDLAHMLLSSPHFSSFMEEMNVNGMPQLPTQQQSQQPQPQPQQQQQQPSQQSQPQAMPQPSVPKDANPNAASQEFQMPQNVVMVPNQGMDMSALGLNNGGWNSGIDINYANVPVFAVTEVPEGPAIDPEVLSRKSSSVVESCLPGPTKDEAPTLDRPPMVEESKKEYTGVENPDFEIDENDPAFTLFLDSPATSSSQETPEKPFEGVKSEKFELVVEGESQATADRFAQLCLSMEAAFQRVSMVTSHLL